MSQILVPKFMGIISRSGRPFALGAPVGGGGGGGSPINTVLSSSASGLAVSNNSGSYNGTAGTQKSFGGNIVLGPFSDPGGSGIIVDLHRVYQTQTPISGGIRSEILWDGAAPLTPGVESWLQFCVRIKSGEGFPFSATDDEMLLFQSHTPASGSTQPDLALFMYGQSGNMRWRVAYQTSPPAGDGSTTTEGNPWITPGESIPTADTWCKFIIQHRAGYLAGHNPLINIWRKYSTDADYVQIVTNYTGFNTYNNPSPSYWRKGLYRYTGANWTTSPVGIYYDQNLYYQQGSNLYLSAKACNSGL